MKQRSNRLYFILLILSFAAIPIWSQTEPCYNYPETRECSIPNDPNNPGWPWIRDAYIPDQDDPIKMVKIRFVGYAEEDGSNPTASIGDVIDNLNQLNIGYEPNKIQFHLEEFEIINDPELMSWELSYSNWPYIFVSNYNALTVYIINILGPAVGVGGTPNLLSGDVYMHSAGVDSEHFASEDGYVTLIHEVGHVLGLRHTHLGTELSCDNDCYPYASGFEADLRGDLSSDTPPVPITWECGDPGGTDCQGTPWGDVDEHNYMGYSTCRSEFTPQQTGRMHAWLDLFYNDYWVMSPNDFQAIYNVNINNRYLDNNENLGGTLSVYNMMTPYIEWQGLQSSDTQQTFRILQNVPYILNTLGISNPSYENVKHLIWDDNRQNYKKKFDYKYFSQDGETKAFFKEKYEINITTSIPGISIPIQILDPWYIEPEGTEFEGQQLEEYHLVDDIVGVNNEYLVFLEQGEISDIQSYPYYKIKTPLYYYNESSGTWYSFVEWQVTNTIIKEMGDLYNREIIAVFQSEVETLGGTITAVYQTTNTLTQNIELYPNYENMVSLNVVPLTLENEFDNLDIEYLFGEYDVLKVSENEFLMFWIPGGINWIGDLSFTNGYKISMGSPGQTMNILGVPLYPKLPITLKGSGWENYLPYLHQTPMPIETALESIAEDIFVVQSDLGGFYVPLYNLNSIYNLEPGEAYYLTSNGSDDITFSYPDMPLARPSCDEMNSSESQLTHFELNKTARSIPFLIDELNADYQIGDELALFCENDLVGALKINNTNDKLLLIAWSQTTQDELYRSIENLDYIFKLWRSNDNTVHNLFSAITKISYGESNLYKCTVSESNNGIPISFILHKPVPNPFNPVTTISYDLPQTGVVNIIIFDVLGRQITQLVNAVEDPGYHSVTWDATQFASGTYFVKLTSGDFTQTQKVMLVK
ncbi:MAG: T9SS type A sorting domain-containing protein [Candidatus Marinimicrobia bacterium]|nr:T9SS type A sorting domain-containing protein [Candidatus Neomarinimicrobiota bacterium]